MPVLISSAYPGSCPFDQARLRRAAETLLAICGREDQELSLLLLDDPGMQALNRQYRGKDKPTNVLSFPMADPDDPAADYLLGDIVISVDTARREAGEKKITGHQHCRALLIHGLVHLLGLDHERSAEEARLMLGQEKFLANELRRRERRNPMINLAINVDHVATLRQARGGKEPDPVTAAGICELAGAQGIVVHLREDRRHIQDRDVFLLRQLVKTKLNLEMGAAEEIIRIALDVKPDMITLVPEKRQELTTEGGLNVAGQKAKLRKVVARMEKAGIPVSMFIDPDPAQVKAAREVGATLAAGAQGTVVSHALNGVYAKGYYWWKCDFS